jgi:molybdenum cofactor cytidylyltransferase
MNVRRPRIAGIILAAGESQRMGRPKALLKLGASVFLETIFQPLEESRFDPLITVLGDDFQKVYKSVKNKRKILFLRNIEPEKGQLSSFKCALEHIPNDVQGCLSVLVDHPLVTFPTYLSLHEAGLRMPERIIIPVYRGKRGHPVYWGKKFFDQLLKAPLDKGARYVVQRNEKAVYELAVEDEGVIIDIDTPEDYSFYLKQQQII